MNQLFSSEKQGNTFDQLQEKDTSLLSHSPFSFRCGKTSICQILAKINEQELLTVNCHTSTESADFIGSIRPVRRHEQTMDTNENAGLFEWQDGLLVRSMKGGALFLIDEISLADDSVLERLNSVLEPEKELVLAEKGYQDDDRHIDIIKAHEKFRLVATMNPGGDFGKKEVRVEHHLLAFIEHACRSPSLAVVSRITQSFH